MLLGEQKKNQIENWNWIELTVDIWMKLNRRRVRYFDTENKKK